MRIVPIILLVFLASAVARPGSAQTTYDLLLKGGHVIDARNGIDAVRDVGIKDGRIAALAANLPTSQATKVVDVAGFYVTPGLDMEAKPTAEMAVTHKGVIVGIKSAHYEGPEWDPYIRSVEAGQAANIPVMVDFGSARVRTIAELFEKYFRPGDIYTHAYAGGGRGELIDGKVNPAIFAARKKGIVFDIGHGGGSFVFQTAAQAFKEGFYADSISTDLHVNSMNAGMKDLLNVMGKFLALGMPLADVVQRATWNPAKEIKLDALGHLSIGAPADVAVLRLEKGGFGFLDQRGGRLSGTQKLGCELTVRDGNIVYDLNGLAAQPWETLPPPARRPPGGLD